MGQKVIVTTYVHAEKGYLREQEQLIEHDNGEFTLKGHWRDEGVGVPVTREAAGALNYINYEVELKIEVDTQTGDQKIVEVDGRRFPEVVHGDLIPDD